LNGSPSLDELNRDQIVTETICSSGVLGKLFARWWLPTQQPVKGCAVIIHGLGEHGGRYAPVAKEIARDGWASLVTDLQGHGKSPGRRGHAASYLGLLEDIHAMRAMVQHRFPDLPQVLIGHSMGGNLAANYALRQNELKLPPGPQAGPVPLAGLVLSGPMFLPSNPPTRPQIFAAWSTGYLMPWFTIRAPVDSTKLSTNPDTLTSLRSDDLVHNRISLYLATQLLAQGRYALDHASELNISTLIMHGQDDPITDYRASESFAIRAGNHVKCVIYPGMLHEIFHETNAETVFQTLRDWLKQFTESQS
jgi:alpha-beta hydrolase superfamily lysophospholipase